jgi:hypothetical protein
MKLNWWQTVGVWLSILWLVGVTMFAKHNFAAGAVPILTLWILGYGIAFVRRFFRARAR